MITNKLKINDGLSVNVGESQITQSLKVRDLCVTFDQFLNIDDHITAICRSIYFYIRNIGKIRNLFSYNDCSTIIHALISCRLDYCNSLLYRVPMHLINASMYIGYWTLNKYYENIIKLITCKDFRINVHVY